MSEDKKDGIRTIHDVAELMSKLTITEVKGALYSLFHHTRTEVFVSMVKGGSIWMSIGSYKCCYCERGGK